MDISDNDGYIGALRAAGADVLACKSFGSYQGDWWAKIRVGGVEMWAHGGFGSQCRAHRYGNAGRPVPGCPDCAESAKRYRVALAEFGQDYIDDAVTQVAAEAAVEKSIAWDDDAADMLAFLRANRIA